MVIVTEDDGYAIGDPIEGVGMLYEGPGAYLTLDAASGVTDFVVPAEVDGQPVRGLRAQMAGLTSLDLSACPTLAYLDCMFNDLTSLDVTGCPELAYLDCFGNQIAQLDLFACPGLVSLDCGRNQLTALDVTSCAALTYLGCTENALASLSLPASRS